jgi:hypothetical protein
MMYITRDGGAKKQNMHCMEGIHEEEFGLLSGNTIIHGIPPRTRQQQFGQAHV